MAGVTLVQAAAAADDDAMRARVAARADKAAWPTSATHGFGTGRFCAIDLFEAGGWSAIEPALRGRSRGDGRVLSVVQEEAVQRLIIDKRPEQLKMDFSLRSRAAVGQLIEQEFGIKLQVRSIGKYLTRWGFTPQKPIKRTYEQSPEAVQNWLQGEYPAIEQRARAEGAEIH